MHVCSLPTTANLLTTLHINAWHGWEKMSVGMILLSDLLIASMLSAQRKPTLKKKQKKKTSMALFLMYKTNILLYNVIIKLTVRTLYILMAIYGPACGKRFLFVVKKATPFCFTQPFITQTITAGLAITS